MGSGSSSNRTQRHMGAAPQRSGFTPPPDMSDPHPRPMMPRHSDPMPLPVTHGDPRSQFQDMARPQMNAARNNFHDMRDQWQSLDRGSPERQAMRGDFMAARDDFRDMRQQFTGQQPPVTPGGSPGSVVHGVFGPQAFGVPGGTGPMLPQDRAANRAAQGGQPGAFPGQGGGVPDWVRNLFQRGR